MNRSPETDPDRDEDTRQMIELLNELRVAIPGVQILFGFLLTVPFASGFDDTTSLQRGLLVTTMLCTAASTVCLIAPSAAHRILFHLGERRWLIERASTLLLVGLGLLALALIAAVALVTDVVYGGVGAVVAPGLLALGLGFLWFLQPIARRRRRT